MKVLITGGAGFLGRGILRAIERGLLEWEPTVFSRDEAKHIKIRSRFPFAHIIRGDVTESVDLLARTFSGYDLIIHAGANKLIDIGEYHAREVVHNNITGSQHVADAAIMAGVKRVIGISTDKAVQPVNIYGATKMVMERIFQNADELSDTEFTCARYGNVVGSTISIITYFKEQLVRDGVIQLTDLSMTRFYMGIEEAIADVLEALTAKRGSIVIPKMYALPLPDVARIALGAPPDADLSESPWKERIRIVGPRAGEKTHESLLHKQESVRVLQSYIEHEGDPQFYHLRPIGERHRTVEFEITSDNPPLGHMPFEMMNDLIEDSINV